MHEPEHRARFERDLQRLASIDQHRSLAPVGPLRGQRGLQVARDGRPVALFSSNDYLGLSQHAEVRQAAAEAAAQWGMGPRGSALVCGYSEPHAALAADLARLKGAEAAVLFPTGYQANVAALQALAAPGVTIFSDALNHASIIDGCRLAKAAGAQICVYRHRDLAHLAQLLAAHEGLRVIVSDVVFSMDGTRTPLAELVALKRRFGALLVTDAAHATLVFGPGGSGLAGALGLSAEIDLQVGTLSKAFGAQGGFVAASRLVIDWLVNRARGLIFSTALPVPVVAAAHAALRVGRREEALRTRLRQHEARLAALLDQSVEGPIVPIIFGEAQRALEASAALAEAGFHVPAIRPPTVPAGTSRLRVALSAAHTEAQVEALCAALRPLLRR